MCVEMASRQQLDSLYGLFTDLNQQVEKLTTNGRGRLEISSIVSGEIPSIPSIRFDDSLTCRVDEISQLKERVSQLERSGREQASLLAVRDAELATRVAELEACRKQIASLMADSTRLSAMVNSMRAKLQTVAMEGDVRPLMEFSPMSESGIDPNRFVEVMTMMILNRGGGAPPPFPAILPTNMHPLPQHSVSAISVEELPNTPVSTRQIENIPPPPPHRPAIPLVLKSAELREKIQQARMIVEGHNAPVGSAAHRSPSAMTNIRAPSPPVRQQRPVLRVRNYNDRD